MLSRTFTFGDNVEVLDLLRNLLEIGVIPGGKLNVHGDL